MGMGLAKISRLCQKPHMKLGIFLISKRLTAFILAVSFAGQFCHGATTVKSTEPYPYPRGVPNPISQPQEYQKLLETNKKTEAEYKNKEEKEEPPIFHPPKIMDVFIALVKDKEATLVPKGCVLNNGEKSGVLVTN